MSRMEEESHLSIAVENLPEPEPCLVCGEKTERVGDLEYQVGSTTRKTPGYRCLGCGLEWLTPDVSNEILTGRLDFLRKQLGGEAIQREIEAIEELIKISRRYLA